MSSAPSASTRFARSCCVGDLVACDDADLGDESIGDAEELGGEREVDRRR